MIESFVENAENTLMGFSASPEVKDLLRAVQGREDISAAESLVDELDALDAKLRSAADGMGPAKEYHDKMIESIAETDEELMEFREIINEKLAKAKLEYDELMDSLTHRDGNDVDDTSPTYHSLEEGSHTQSKEEIINMAARQTKFIKGLQEALVRIENKTYGICRVTGQLIPKERLRAVPHATTSIEGKLKEQSMR